MWLALVLAVSVAEADTGHPSQVLDRIAAVVGDDILLVSDVDRYAAIGIVEQKPGENEAAYRERILNERVVELLREREVRKIAGFDPDPREVETRFKVIGERVTKERGIPFEKVLSGAGVSRDEALDWTRRGLAIQTYVMERLLPTIKVTDAEMEAFYSGPFQAEARAKSLITVPPLREVEDQVRILLKERKLNAEIERWTEELRQKTRVVLYRRPPRP